MCIIIAKSTSGSPVGFIAIILSLFSRIIDIISPPPVTEAPLSGCEWATGKASTTVERKSVSRRGIVERFMLVSALAAGVRE